VLPLIALFLLAAAPEDRGLGVWRFLPAESTYESAPAPKESKRQWLADGEWVRFLHDGINAQGKPFHTEFKAKYDGKSYPFIGGTLYDAVSLKLVNPSKVEQTFTMKGTVTVRATRTISPDGKRMTIISLGDKFKNTLIYERVQ
jgi:hypothetical protein